MSDTIVVAILTLIGTLAPILVTILTTASKTNKKVDAVEEKLNQHIKEQAWVDAKQTRTRILRFYDEISAGKDFSEDLWENTLEDIDTYEQFCEAHKDFHNNKGKIAMAHIKAEYQRLKAERYFIKR